MGKHERAAIEAAEESVVAILKGKPSTLPPGHPWAGHDVIAARHITRDFPHVVSAEHGGNTYADAGDIRLILSPTSSRTVELKFSRTPLSLGTAANISQDALTLYGLFPDATSWSEWRLSRRFADQVVSILDTVDDVQRATGIKAKGRLVKALAESGDVAASAARDRVRDLARRDRMAYVEYLASRPYDVTRIRGFCLCLLVGAHTRQAILQRLSAIESETTTAGMTTHTVYYTNVDGSGIHCRSLPRHAIAKVGAFTDFAIQFGDGDKISGGLYARDGKGQRHELLTFIHHWKNVFAGIETPCINVFLGRYLKNLVHAHASK